MPTWSGITLAEIDQAVRYFATLPREFRLSVLDRQSEITRRKRKDWPGKVSAEFYERALALAALEMRDKERALGKKQENIDPDELARIRRLRVMRASRTKAKGSPKAQHIRNRYWLLIKQLREESNLSWRQVSDYLAKYHKFKACHTYIKQEWEAQVLTTASSHNDISAT